MPIMVDRHVCSINDNGRTREMIVAMQRFVRQGPNLEGFRKSGFGAEFRVPDFVHDWAHTIVLLRVFRRTTATKDTPIFRRILVLVPNRRAPAIPKEFKNRRANPRGNKLIQVL